MPDTMKSASKGVVLAKIETTYGTDSTPAGSNGILVEDPKVELVGKSLTRNAAVNYYGSKKKLNIGEAYKLSFKTELKGSGAAGTVPEIGVLFRIANFTELITAGTKVEYTPNSLLDSGESASVYFYLDGVLRKLVGSKAVKIGLEAKAGEYGYLSWELQGLYAGPVEQAAPTVTPNPTQPARFVNAQFQIDTYAAIIETLKIDVENKLIRRGSANAPTGVLGFHIGGREVKGSIDPEVVPFATKNFWSLWENSTEVAFTSQFGSVAGNKIITTAPAVQIADVPKDANRDNIYTLDVPLQFNPTSAGNDELKFSFQ